MQKKQHFNARFLPKFYTLVGLVAALGFFAQPVRAEDQRNLAHVQLLVSVADYSGKQDAWKREVCALVYKAMNNFGAATDVVCRSLDTTSLLDPQLKDFRKKFDYHLQISRERRNTDIKVQVTNWQPRRDTDFETVGRVLPFTPEVKWQDQLMSTVANVAMYLENQEYYQEAIFYEALGIGESETLMLDPKGGIHDKLTGEVVPFEKAYEEFTSESPRKRNWARMMTELGVLYSGFFAVYLKTNVYNSQDFDYTVRESLTKKVLGFSAWRFDDNDKYANAGHAWAGALYANTARSNGFTSLESLAVSVAGSFVWETLEFHEVHSLNDDVVTGVGGWILNEAAFQVGCALLKKDSVVAKTIGTAINPGEAMSRFFDKNKSKKTFTDECDKERWSEISVYLGRDSKQKPFTEADAEKAFVIGLRGETFKDSHWGKEGKEDYRLGDTVKTDFEIDTSGGDWRIAAHVLHEAMVRRNLEKTAAGELVGYQFAYGIGSGLTWSDRGTDKKDDFYGAVHILGPAAIVQIYRPNGVVLTVNAAAYADFMMPLSMSYDSYIAAEGKDGLASNLTKRGDYYGFGTTLMGSMLLQLGRFSVGADYQDSSGHSINGRERFSEKVTRREDFYDSYRRIRLRAGYLLAKNWRVEASVEKIMREGKVNGDFAVSDSETVRRLTLHYLF